MRTIWNIALNNIRIFFQDRGNLISLLVIPVIFTFVVGGAGGGGGPTRVLVDVLDRDNSTVSSQFLQHIREANSSLVLCPMDDKDNSCNLDGKPLDEAASQQRLVDKVALAQIEIPAGFEKAATGGGSASIIYRTSQGVTAGDYILQAVQAANQQVGGAAVAARVGTTIAEGANLVKDADKQTFSETVYDAASKLWASKPASVSYVESAKVAQVSTAQQGFGQSVPGMGTMFVLFTVFNAMVTLMQERKNWTFQRMLMMPVSRAQLLGGKILAWFILGIMQYAVVFAVGIFMKVNFGHDALALALVMVAFTLCATALAFALVTLVRNDQQANSVALLMTLTLAPLGGAWWSLDIVPAFMRTVGHISPVAWAMDAFRSLVFENGSLMTVLPSIGVLLMMTALFFAFAVWRFRYE
jgi:ABC-2 type transport system permease protein